MDTEPRGRLQRMHDLVDRLVTATTAAGALEVRQELTDPALRTWSYLPGDRPGLCLEDAPEELVSLVDGLVEIAHSPAGAALFAEAAAVERERRRAASGRQPNGDRYWWRHLGDPGAGGPWGWRLNGHHIAVHVVVDGPGVTFTPHFVGSEPARITAGPLAGSRILGPEEDLARSLVTSLTPAQRVRAVTLTEAPADIVTGMDPVADPGCLPGGITWAELDATQRGLLRRLVDRYLGRLPADIAARYRGEALDAPDRVEFAWAGDTGPGRPHYYCVRTPTVVIEYDNTQDGGNHAHSVLRHLRDDFGGDALRDHLRLEHG